METKKKELRKIAPMSARVTVVPKFTNKCYTEGSPERVCIDHLENDKVCVYLINGNSYRAGQSYKVFDNLESLFDSFEIREVQYSTAESQKHYQSV